MPLLESPSAFCRPMCEVVWGFTTEWADSYRLFFIVDACFVGTEEGRVPGSDFCQEGLVTAVCDEGPLLTVGYSTIDLFCPLMCWWWVLDHFPDCCTNATIGDWGSLLIQ